MNINIRDNCFHMTLANGYTVSLVNHSRPYSDGGLGTTSDTVEAWAFRDGGESHSNPRDNLSPEGVLDYLEEVASLPHRGISLCPDCGQDYMTDCGHACEGCDLLFPPLPPILSSLKPLTV